MNSKLIDRDDNLAFQRLGALDEERRQVYREKMNRRLDEDRLKNLRKSFE